MIEIRRRVQGCNSSARALFLFSISRRYRFERIPEDLVVGLGVPGQRAVQMAPGISPSSSRGGASLAQEARYLTRSSGRFRCSSSREVRESRRPVRPVLPGSLMARGFGRTQARGFPVSWMWRNDRAMERGAIDYLSRRRFVRREDVF